MLALWSCSTAIHVSFKMREEWSRRCFFPRSRTRVIHNGVREHSLAAATPRASLGAADSDFIFCLAAGLSAGKGHDYLLDAIRLSPQDFQGSKVFFCGSGPMFEELQSQCRTPPLSDTVGILGFRTDVLDIMAASDCIVLPSLSENLSRVVLEGMMLGKPVIATDVGGLSEAVINEENGLLVPPRSPTALRDAMVRVMRDREWARQLGRRARQDALQRFTHQRMIAEYVQVFFEAASDVARLKPVRL
jgi:glycosyltransferase involved in cell wall biosynthesis